MTESNFKPEAAYLTNLAETIQQYLLPMLVGEAHSRAKDCMVVALRVAVSLDVRDAADKNHGSALAAETESWEGADRRFQDLFSSVTSSEPQFRREMDAGRIERALRANPLGGDGLRLKQARLLPGGRSKLTIILEQEGAAALPRNLVIRQDWMALAGTSVTSEFGLLQTLWKHDIRVPQPFIIEADKETLGAPAMVVARSPGKQNGDILTAPSDQAVVLAAAETLGRIHGLGDTPFEHLPAIGERNFTWDQLAQSLQAFRGAVDQFEVPESTVLNQALDWLGSTLDRISGPRVLVHGDYGFHNLLFDGSRLTAVLDWELTHLGNPAYDLGYLRGVVEQSVEWDVFLQHYRKGGGPEVDAFTVDWFALYTGIWLYHILLQARAGVMAGQVHDIEIVSVCAHIRPPLRVQIANLFRRVSAGHAVS